MLSTLFLKLIDEEKFITIIHVAVSSQRGDHGCELKIYLFFILYIIIYVQIIIIFHQE